MNSIHRSLITVHVLFASTMSIFAQGSLTPPGAPAATMKSLDQIASTGIALNATNTPGDATYHYVISAPGSYYLKSNLDVTKPSGIHIIAAGVSVDLNGFQISRASGSGGDGIRIDMTAHRCSIKNGNVSGFSYGLYCFSSGAPAAHGGILSHVSASACDTGVQLGDAWTVESCQAHDNLNTGLSTGWGSTVSNCTAYGNQVFLGIVSGWGSALINCTAYNNHCVYPLFAGYGSTLTNCSALANTVDSPYGAIVTQAGCTLTNCSAINNTATWGIATDVGCALLNCSAHSNTSVDATSGGIHAGYGTSVINCVANSNRSSNATAAITTGMGIDADNGVLIKDCTTQSNKGDGIRVASNCVVSGCASTSNGLDSPNGDGIRASGDFNRIDSNQANSNSLYGIRSSATNFVTRNTAVGNGTANYNPSTGANFGPIQSIATATSPWANF